MQNVLSKFQHHPSFCKRTTLVRNSGGSKVVFPNIVKNSFRVLEHIFGLLIQKLIKFCAKVVFEINFPTMLCMLDLKYV